MIDNCQPGSLQWTVAGPERATGLVIIVILDSALLGGDKVDAR
jgi:hypothetical protein